MNTFQAPEKLTLETAVQHLQTAQTDTQSAPLQSAAATDITTIVTLLEEKEEHVFQVCELMGMDTSIIFSLHFPH